MLTVGLIAHDLVEGPVAGQDAEVGERCVTSVEYPNLGLLVRLNVIGDRDTDPREVGEIRGELVFYDPLCVLLRLDRGVPKPGVGFLHLPLECVGGAGCYSVHHARRELDVRPDPIGELVLVGLV